MKYRVIHFDPMTWQMDECIVPCRSLEDAEITLEKLLANYPLSSHGSARIERYEVLKEVMPVEE
jgi:hypothetical protein